jgi:predicted nucleotidyltransferase
MTITPYADIDQLLVKLLANLQQILDNKLIGLYLYGSLVTGDFDTNRSDIDLLAVLELLLYPKIKQRVSGVSRLENH